VSDASDQRVQPAESAEPFERAKRPMVIAAIAMVAGLAIAGSLDRTPAHAGDPAPSVPFGGAVVLAAWVVGIGALHRLGRAGSMDRSENRPRAAEPPKPAASDEAEEEEDDEPEPEEPEPDEPEPDERKPD
jgi:hypothetical protein